MSVVRARTVAEAVEAAARPGALLVSGGTEVTVALTERRLRPEHLVTLRRIPELRGVRPDADAGEVLIGALTTYAELAADPAVPVVLAQMAPTVGSPASRNAGTIGGALGTGSGAGDAVTALLALDAWVVVASAAGVRRVPVAGWLDRSERRAGDVVTAVAVPVLPGPQHYLKAGERQAVFYASASCALVVHGTTLRCALGSVAPQPVRALAAEDFAAGLAWRDGRPVADDAALRRFGELAATGLEPAAGPRVSAAYRRHVAGVLATRALARAAA